jgi:osmoprotectant transport system permease protein
VAETTVGVLVGHGGLGQLIVGGFNANFYRAEIVTGSLGCVLLALLFDLVLAGIGRALTPWTRLRTA